MNKHLRYYQSGRKDEAQEIPLKDRILRLLLLSSFTGKAGYATMLTFCDKLIGWKLAEVEKLAEEIKMGPVPA